MHLGGSVPSWIPLPWLSRQPGLKPNMITGFPYHPHEWQSKPVTDIPRQSPAVPASEFDVAAMQCIFIISHYYGEEITDE
jgi:hypothetical protein